MPTATNNAWAKPVRGVRCQVRLIATPLLDSEQMWRFRDARGRRSRQSYRLMRGVGVEITRQAAREIFQSLLPFIARETFARGLLLPGIITIARFSRQDLRPGHSLLPPANLPDKYNDLVSSETKLSRQL